VALGAYIDAVEERHGGAFPPGRTAGLRFMAHLWEPLPAQWKPLAVHAGAEAMRAGTCAALRALGFRASRCQVGRGQAALAAWARGADAHSLICCQSCRGCWPRGVACCSAKRARCSKCMCS